MNLQKLFEMQAKLDADITVKHPVQEGENRLEKKVLALLVELGECANEWRGFKFWSNDQEPRVTETCGACSGRGKKRRIEARTGRERYFTCQRCNGLGVKGNPLLEEYVDCLHFILSIGNDAGYSKDYEPLEYDPFVEHLFFGDSLEKFNDTFRSVTRFEAKGMLNVAIEYDVMFDDFLGLGKSLGFTWDQIEQAYYDKNKINFERQENGY